MTSVTRTEAHGIPPSEAFHSLAEVSALGIHAWLVIGHLLVVSPCFVVRWMTNPHVGSVKPRIIQLLQLRPKCASNIW